MNFYFNLICKYLLVFGYIFLEIFLVGILFKNKQTEVKRKIIHILLFGVWIILEILFKNTIHQVIIPFCFIVINFLSYKFKLFKVIEREENNHLGTVYFSMAVFLVMLFCYLLPQYYIYSGIAVFTLTFGDGFAALIGNITKSKKIKDNKSLNGFLACFIFSFLSLIIFKYIYMPNISLIYLLIISLFAAIFELVGKGLDNFSVTIGIFILSILLIEYNNIMLNISIIIAMIIFLIVFFTKSILYYGALLSMIIVISFGFFGDYKSLIFLLISYFTSYVISIVRKKILKNPSKNLEGRKFNQIFSNGICGTLSIIIYHFTQNKLFYLLALLCIAGCLIDSISSDIGTLSKKDPIDIIGFKKMNGKLSGGISFLGTFSAFIAAVGLGLYATLISGYKIYFSFIIIVLIFLQTIVDSIIGSIFQIKYKCNVCGIITEKEVHCTTNTLYYKGIKWMNNNIVNLLSSIIIWIISILVIGLV